LWLFPALDFKLRRYLRVTPAMEAGVADHVWTMEEIAALGAPVAPAKREPYKKAAQTV
jgi:hypothetical protein